MANRRRRSRPERFDGLAWYCDMLGDLSQTHETLWLQRAGVCLAKKGSRVLTATKEEQRAFLLSDRRHNPGIPRNTRWTRTRWVRAWVSDMRLAPNEVALLRAIYLHMNEVGLTELDFGYWAPEQHLLEAELRAAIAAPPVRDYLLPLALPERALFLTTFPEEHATQREVRLQAALEHVWSYAPQHAGAANAAEDADDKT